jgi:hypothetical protein
MDNRIRQILGEYKYKEAVNTNTYIPIQINGSERLLPPGEINKVLDVTEQFDYERQACKYYRIIGKINPLISNVLFNTTGTQDCWEVLSSATFTTNNLNANNASATYAESIKRNLKENNGWYGYNSFPNSTGGFCNFNYMEPKKSRFLFEPDTTNIPGSLVKNWELTITYPYSSDTTHKMVISGLSIVDKVQVNVGGVMMTALSVPVFHNLLNGGTIRLRGTNLDGDYEIKRIGLDNGTLKEYYFCIDVDFNTLTLTPNSKMTKLYDGVESVYYFRKFKKIKTKYSSAIQPDDYETYNLAFSQNIFSDDIVQFIFNEDIDITDAVDNLNRPLSELYLTIIKTDSNNIFSRVSSGIEAPILPNFNTGNINTYLKNIPVIQKIHNVPTAPSQTFNALELDVKINNTDYYGDVVEYNVITVNEVVLSDVYYRFNTINRETTGNAIVPGPRPEGYYYKAHHLIRIKNLSSYIEEGVAKTQNMPTYAVNLGDGRFFWRDLLDIGRTDVQTNVVDYPFVNGSHYLYQNYCFSVKRQDPFDNWDLYFSQFPPDPIGNTMNNNFTINSADNVC